MSYQLNLDQMLETLQQTDHPDAAALIKTTENLANCIALKIAKALGIECGEGTFEGVAFAGLCVPFRPSWEGQELPEVFATNGFDATEEWEPEN